jgi:hypothetical protein
MTFTFCSVRFIVDYVILKVSSKILIEEIWMEALTPALMTINGITSIHMLEGCL